MFLLMPKHFLFKQSESYIKIKVKKEGTNKILSDEYLNTLPKVLDSQLQSKSYSINPKKEITLVWDSTLDDLSFMFNGLHNIISVEIQNMFAQNCILSYMFSNCINLENVIIKDCNQEENAIKDIQGMFYNCISLTNFSFNYLYLDSIGKTIINDHESCLYNNINMSYMFYNCTKLATINMGSNSIQNINDMNHMFYNCNSLSSINLKNIKTGELYSNLSFMFYNCKELTSIELYSFNIKVNDMQ